MNQKIIDWTEKVIKKYGIEPKKVLDVGSLNVNGTVKHLFPNAKYTGIDFRAGKDVDFVMNAHDIGKLFAPFSFDAVVCMNTLEHDDKFWKSLDEIISVLKEGGYLLIAWPTIDFPIHDHPGDYWRITEQAMKEIVFKDQEFLEQEIIYTKTSDAGKPINGVICAVGRKK